MTIRRNDSCPCGSGKKYKKCHGGKEDVSIQQVVNEELTSIIQNFYRENPERKDLLELRLLLNKWNARLKGFWPAKQIEQQVVDYYLLLQRQDIWQKHVAKQMQKTVRPSVLEVLQNWTSPMMLIGEIVEVEPGFVTVKEVIDGKIYELDILGDTRATKGNYVIGMVLPDSRRGSNGIMVISGISFLPNWISNGVEHVKQLAKESKLDTQTFYQAFLLDCLSVIMESPKLESEYIDEINDSETPNSDSNDNEIPSNDSNLTAKQTEMLVALENMMNENRINNDQLIRIFSSYIIECSPNPRKAEAVAAGAVRFAKERLSADEFPWTNKEIAAMFEVSTSTVQKYFEEIDAFSAVPV